MAYQKDISAVLGLSVSTVSKALKGYPDISEETKRKVLKTAEELDYKYGEGERRSRMMSGTIGILAPGSADLVKSPYYREMLCGMAGEAAERRRDLLIMGEDCAEQQMSWVGRVAARRVDGVCLLASREDLYKGRFAEILESNIPLISVENEVTGHTSICRDFRKNAAAIMGYLKKKGHRITVFPGDQSIGYRKYASILRGEARKLEMECLETDLPTPSAENVLSLSAKAGVTCVVFTSRTEAACRIREWENSGLMIPEDISAIVLQTDREEWGSEEDRITCLSNAPSELGREAVRRLVQILEHPEMDIGERISLEGSIEIGRTVSDLGRRVDAGR